MDQDKKITDPFYGTATWQKFRRWYRKQHPLCEICLAAGFHTPGHLVDHIVELKDGGNLLDPDNCQTLCNRCHGKKTVSERIKRGASVRQPKVYSY
ncbi:MAG: HNH endonuclease [Proteobacteria bacterium]|nr:HNH endonuclease [Pseudomonadota bacterium]